MKKPLLIGLLVVAAVIGLGLAFFFSNLNSLVASVIEDSGSSVTETEVAVFGVDIQLREGRGSIRGVRIGSPEGFSTDNIFEMDDVTVDLDVGSVRENPVVLDEVRIRAPVVHAELNEEGALNLDELRKRIQRYSGDAGQDSGGDSGSQKRIRIATFVLEEGRVEIDASAIGVEAKTITLPEIRLQDVGGSEGTPPDQIAKIILSTFAKESASRIARSEVQSLIEDQLGESLGEKAKGLLDELKK